jgi:hypothetical protein
MLAHGAFRRDNRVGESSWRRRATHCVLHAYRDRGAPVRVAAATGAITGARRQRPACYPLVCSIFVRLARRFLNRVHWFGAGRGHLPQGLFGKRACGTSAAPNVGTDRASVYTPSTTTSASPGRLAHSNPTPRPAQREANAASRRSGSRSVCRSASGSSGRSRRHDCEEARSASPSARVQLRPYCSRSVGGSRPAPWAAMARSAGRTGRGAGGARTEAATARASEPTGTSPDSNNERW